jgi:GNAT superfamily N-acetyltransferase
VPVEIEVRPYERADGLGPAEVVRAVFAEYGFIFELDGWDKDLADVSATYTKDGAFWVATDGPAVVGCVGVKPQGGDHCELKRLYVLASHRGHNLGERLCLEVLAWARSGGYRRVELWSDKKFPHAHALYRRLGFQEFGERINDDPDQSHEWGFALDLGA